MHAELLPASSNMTISLSRLLKTNQTKQIQIRMIKGNHEADKNTKLFYLPEEVRLPCKLTYEPLFLLLIIR